MLFLLQQDSKLSLAKANPKSAGSNTNDALALETRGHRHIWPQASQFVNRRPEMHQHLFYLPSPSPPSAALDFEASQRRGKSSPGLPSSPAVRFPSWNQFVVIFKIF